MNLRYISKTDINLKQSEKDERKLNELKAFTKKQFFGLSKKNISIPIYFGSL